MIVLVYLCSSSPKIARQLDAHEYSASDKRNDNENECKDKLQCAIEPWDVTGVGLVQDNEAQCTTSEEERGGQSFHYVLPVDPVLHKCHRPRMSLLICSGSDGRRLHYHVVYYASSDKKVREEDESKYVFVHEMVKRVKTKWSAAKILRLLHGKDTHVSDLCFQLEKLVKFLSVLNFIAGQRLVVAQ